MMKTEEGHPTGIYRVKKGLANRLPQEMMNDGVEFKLMNIRCYMH